MKLIILFLVVSILSGCGVTLPEKYENTHTFTQTSDIPFKKAYKTILRQMKGCYVGKGFFGNGHDVSSYLDSSAKEGIIEVIFVGLTGVYKYEESIYSRIVTVTQSENNGSQIVITGTTPKFVYMTHISIKSWLNGNTGCTP